MKRVDSKYHFNVQWAYCLLVSILPIAANYSFFGLDIGMGTFIIAVAGMMSLLYLGRRRRISPGPLLLMYLYFMVRKIGQSSTDLILLGFALINMVRICKSDTDAPKLKRIVEDIAILNTFLVAFQVALYYATGIDLVFVNPAWLNESATLGINSGSLYRAAGMFLEPAHFSQYCSMGLLFALFPLDGQKADLKRAMLIAAGCVLTTSGIGIALVVGILGWYILFTKRRAGSRITHLLLGCFAAVLAFVALMQVEAFRLALQRVFGEVDGYNAMSGRLWAWDVTVKKMQGFDLLFGYGTDSFFEGYLTGLMHLIMEYGIIGTALLAFALVYAIAKAGGNFVTCGSIIYLGLLVVADVSSVYAMVFFMGLVYSSACSTRSRQLAERWKRDQAY